MHEARGTRGFVDCEGLQLSYLRYPGDGPDVVLVPGITSTAMALDFLSVELQPRHNVFAVDVRGRGKSDRTGPGRYGLSEYARDLHCMVAALALSDPVLAGHSLGARIVAAAAVTMARHAPLILIDPPLSRPGRPYPTTLDMFRQQMDEARSGTTPEAVRKWFPSWAQRELEIRVEELPTCDRVAVEESYAGLEADDFTSYFRQLTAPVAVIYGTESPAVTPGDVPLLKEANAAATVIGVPNAGHMVPWDNLDGFLRAWNQIVVQTEA